MITIEIDEAKLVKNNANVLKRNIAETEALALAKCCRAIQSLTPLSRRVVLRMLDDQFSKTFEDASKAIDEINRMYSLMADSIKIGLKNKAVEINSQEQDIKKMEGV